MSHIVIRHSTGADARALERLATLDSRALAEGPYLLAEVDERLVAAVPLGDHGEPIADPFRPTAALSELLQLRARQVRTPLPWAA